MAVLHSQLCTVVVSAFLCSNLWALKLQTDSQDNEAKVAPYTVTLKNSANIQYSGDFTIGQQTLPVIFDTGSFEVLTLSTRCKNCAANLGLYDESKSISFKKGENIGSHKYVSGEIITQEGYDDLRIGGTDSPHVAKGMTFWLVTSHSMSFWSNGRSIFSGIVGLSHVNKLPLAFSGDNNDLRSMLTEMGIKSFSLCLSRSTSASFPPGYLSFGFDAAKMMAEHPGNFQSASVVGDTHWSTLLSGLQIDGIDTSNYCKPHCSALIDSGTSLLAFPLSFKSVTDRLTDRISSDCSNIDQLPVLSFNLGDGRVLLPPKAYVFKGSKDGKPACRGGFMHIQKKSQFGEVFMLGMPFLRYYYTIFDRQNSKLHFARSTNDCEVSKVTASWLLGSNQTELERNNYQPEISVFKTVNGGKNARYTHLEGSGLSQDDFSNPTLGDVDDAILPMWAMDGPENVSF
eukprot:TRINITY_DN14572_c0_g2_i1.p1 TRINITY_DN14572_c0_g2~~TRINITY_DN14572_c0_g2_i1.p1  ORF type:complete len:457 (+),score=48.34 TRINITY_DN14572_c0_g2_i1:56-1426(+)